MAPRRGGGGSGSSIGKCQQNNAFGYVESQATIAFVAIFFLIYSVQVWQVFRRRNDCKAGWIPLFMSIVSMWIATTVYLIILPIYECGSLSPRGYADGHLAIAWLEGIASIAMMGTILVPLCKLLQGGKIAVIINSIYTAFLAIMHGSALAVQTAISVDQVDGVYYDNGDLLSALKGLRIALNVSLVLGVLLAAIVIILQLARRPHLREGKLRIFLACIILLALAYTLTDLAWYLTAVYSFNATIEGSLAVVFLNYFFYAGVIAFLPLALSSHQLSVGHKVPSHVVPPPASYGQQDHFIPQGAR